MNMVYWKSDKLWLGKLLEHPEIMTQGETLEDLEKNIRDAFFMMAMGDGQDDYSVREN
jgi:predicted RNase H-like HicB family nuclease